MIRVFGMPSHAAIERTSGVDFARVIQPMKHLDNLKDFKVTIYQPKKGEKVDWLSVITENDVLFLNYTTNPWAFAIMGAIARKHKRKIILDIDDALWEVLPDNTAYRVFKDKEVHKILTSICNEVDYITCTNSYLRNIIVKHSSKDYKEIRIMPNYVDFKLYKHRPPFKDSFNIQLTHFGSSSHFKSLQDEAFAAGVDRIFRTYPHVTLKTVGALVPKYKARWGARYQHGFGDVDIYKWIGDRFPLFMDETDIIVAPLTDNVYNRCKSSIKFIEASSAKKPGVYQRIRQYEEIVKEGKNGFLARTPDEWFSALKKLIEDRELRRRIGENAFKTTEEGWQIQNNVAKYADLFKEALEDS